MEINNRKTIQNGPEIHPACYPKGIGGFFPGDQSAGA
jgi:hypothetical protein